MTQSPDEPTVASDGAATVKLPKPPRGKRKVDLRLIILPICILLLGLLIVFFSNLGLPARQVLGWAASPTGTPTITLTQTAAITPTSTSSPTVTLTSTQTATVTLTGTPEPTLTPTPVPTFTPAVPGEALSLAIIQDVQVVFEIDYQGFLYDLWRNFAFSSEDTLAALSDQQGLRLWRTNDWELVSTLEGGDSFQPGAVVFSPDGSYLASGGRTLNDPSPARIWNIAGPLPFVSFDFPVQRFAFSNDGKLIACQVDDQIKIVRVESGEVIEDLVITGGKILAGPLISPSGKYLAAGNGEWLNIWDITGCAESTGICGSLVLEHQAMINRYDHYLAFTRDDAWVIYNGQALPFIENEKPVLDIPAMKYWLQGDGPLVAYPQLERYRFAFLNLTTGITQFNVSGWETDTCNQCPFSSDGSLYVYTSLQEDTLIPSLMAVKSGKTVLSLESNPNLAGHFFSPDGRFLIVVNQVEANDWHHYKLQIWGLRSP